jgi:hypothetical protein
MMEHPMRHHSVTANHGICRIYRERERARVLRLREKAADAMSRRILKVNPRALA